jgi:hypothetical protein
MYKNLRWLKWRISNVDLFLSLLTASQGHTPDLKIIVQNKVMSFMKEIACSSSRSFSKLLEKAEKS